MFFLHTQETNKDSAQDFNTQTIFSVVYKKA